MQGIEARPSISRIAVARRSGVGAGIDRIHANYTDRPFGRNPELGPSRLCEVFPRARMRDPRLIEQPIGHEHSFVATIHRVVVRGGHDPDTHRLQIVDDRLWAARHRAVVVRVQLVDNRTFHVGVRHVRRAHHFNQSLKPGFAQLGYRATNDDVPDPGEGEGLGDFHRELLCRIAPHLRQHDVSLRCALRPARVSDVMARTITTSAVAASF